MSTVARAGNRGDAKHGCTSSIDSRQDPRWCGEASSCDPPPPLFVSPRRGGPALGTRAPVAVELGTDGVQGDGPVGAVLQLVGRLGGHARRVEGAGEGVV